MSEQGPFDRILDSSANRDPNARLILLGMGVLGVILLALVLLPSLLGGDDNAAGGGGNQPSVARPASSKSSKGPEGFEILSKVEPLQKPKGTNGPYALTVKLTQTVNDGRNLALYTNRSGRWERLATATLVNNGTAVTGQVADMPANVAVLRRVSTAVQMSGWLPQGTQPDPAALDILSTINPVDYRPAADGGVQGSASPLPAGRGAILPTVRAAEQADVEAVNAIVASPQLREAHINALVQLALQPGNGGVDLDYQRVAPARKADFTAFISVLSDRLHQASKSLTISVPAPVKTGVSWDTGAYDWEELARRADTIKLVADPDPSTYYKRMDETLSFLKGKVDLKKVSLTVSRQSYEKGTDGLRSLPLREGLLLASTIEVRTTSQVTPNSAVVIVGKNIFQDDGASGLRWDDAAFAVSFSYPGRGGQRTVWLENGLSIAFKLDVARRYGLGGISLDDVSGDPLLTQIWEPIRTYVESGNISLTQPNGSLLRPLWQIQAGTSEAGPKGNIVWKAPAQPGSYDISLIVSDGVIRASQKIVLEVRPPGASGTASPSASGTARPSTTGTAGPAASPTRPAATVPAVATATARPGSSPVGTQRP
ncbi:MAG TPA: hypothetical protein VJB57_06605 [Dehalococcoidia bacterium]|nr:hypothetical protein [Dehalococcoidia bacterium]